MNDSAEVAAPSDVFLGRVDDCEFREDEAIVERIRGAVASEFDDCDGGSSDAISTAIACTSAVTLFLSSMEAMNLAAALGGGGDDEDDVVDDDDDVGGRGTPLDGGEDMTNENFTSRLRLPLSDLLGEYGERDVDWMTNDRPRMRHVQSRERERQCSSNDELHDDAKDDIEDIMTSDDFQVRLRMPLSKLLAEYGDHDEEWKREGGRMRASTNRGGAGINERRAAASIDGIPSGRDDATAGHGMLAHHGKASVHLELESFGYKYGAPPHARNGFTYTHPLPPLDVRDIDRAPGHVSKFNGLSYLVRRSLLNPSRQDDGDENDEGWVEGDHATTTKEDGRSPMRRRADDIADEIIKVLVESIDEGGHGPLSPLTMTISVGSEYGRHRSVVLVEHLAVVLRARLRRNDGRRFDCAMDRDATGSGGGCTNGIVRQPVSVGTRHRDLDARHQDEEAFGEDLKREARKAEKAKTRQMRSTGWDDDDW